MKLVIQYKCTAIKNPALKIISTINPPKIYKQCHIKSIYHKNKRPIYIDSTEAKY